MIKYILSSISKILYFLFRACNRILMYIDKARFAKCGKNVRFFPLSSGFIFQNIFIGNDVVIGERASFKAFIAKIYIGNKVLFGPNVTIRGGIHPYYVSGRFIFDIGEHEKSPEDDKDVIINDDVWIGANVTILKGVNIGRGAVVAAGAVVTKNIPPYTIAAGIPAKYIGNRFISFSEVIHHETTLYADDNRIDLSILKEYYKD